VRLLGGAAEPQSNVVGIIVTAGAHIEEARRPPLAFAAPTDPYALLVVARSGGAGRCR
jgi:hypothetical protein